MRRYGGRNATVRLEWDVQVTVSLDQEAVAAAVRQLGWRVYVTTHPPAQLSLQPAVRAYRNEYLVERAMGRLKGRPLSLTPMSLEREDHATGLIRLLSLGLRVLTLLEFAVRRHLATAKTTLAGLYVGNPTRAHGAPHGGTPAGGLSRTDADHHPRRPSPAPSSHTPRARATAHSRPPRCPCRHLYEPLSRFSETALKMSVVLYAHGYD